MTLSDIWGSYPLIALAEEPCTLPCLPLDPDLFGQVIDDHFHGRPGDYYLRRDDNVLERDSSARYFDVFR
jgi:hypothetical protein